MNNRRSYSFRHIGAILTAPGLLWGCGKSDLIVDYYVDYSPNFEGFEILHLECFVDYALASEGCVSVHQNSDRPVKYYIIFNKIQKLKIYNLLLLFLIMVFFNILNRPSFPIEDRIHSLQMTGIRNDAHPDRMVVFREIFVMSCAEMVLDIPRKSGYHTLVFSLNLLVVELTENFLIGF